MNNRLFALILISALSACGGKTDPTPTCTDGVKNGLESDVDCGGGCGACAVGKVCAGGGDCMSGMCQAGACVAAPSCTDKVKNGTESDVDCGGPACSTCALGKVCAAGTDCASGSCLSKVCAAAAPTVSTITPERGPSTGGTTITITGTGFSAGATVMVGGTAATNVNVMSATTITAATPAKAGTAGAVDVVVRNTDTQQAMKATAFRYYFGAVGFASVAKTNVAGSTRLGQIVAADLDKDDVLDLAVADFTGAGVQVFIGKADGTFNAPVKYATNAGPLRLAIADFNEDGFLDIAASNNGAANNGSTVSVLINKGAGGAGTFNAKADYTTGAGPLGIVAMDLNQDNHVDLAVANNGTTTISLLTNKATPGTFNSKVDTTLAGKPYDIQSGDFNKDMANDLVVSNSGNTNVSVLLQVKATAGTFAGAVNLTAPAATAGLVVGDFDKDGNADIITAPFNSTMATFFKGSATGVFGNAANTTLLSANGAVPVLAAGDLDLDGSLDLVAASSGDAKAYALVNTGMATLSFKAAQSFMTDTGTAGVALGDFGKAGMGKDGKIDLAVTVSPATAGIGVLLGNHM